MYRIIIILILLIILFYMVRRAFRDWNKKEEPQGLLAKDAMIQDPVCKMYITADSAITKQVNEQTYYFCSQDCAQSFLEKRPS